MKSGGKILGDEAMEEECSSRNIGAAGQKGGRPPVYNNHLQYGRKCSSLDRTDNKWSATGYFIIITCNIERN